MEQLYAALLILVLAKNANLANIVRPRLDGRIVGGSPVDIQLIPYQVSLQRSYHFCGGSLIAKRMVLTAAHCTEGSTESSFKVRIGSSVTNSGGTLLVVRKIHRHEKYNPFNIDYDFSVLELEDYDNDTITSGYIQLPTANDDVPNGTLLSVSGWGNTQNASESRDTLRAVSVPKVKQAKCNRAYAANGGITKRMICAGLLEGGKDACQGDSGGPLVYNKTLVGVVSWGFGCARPKYPGVYARVAAARDWIKTVSGISEES